MVNKERLIKLTQDLVRINSENPPGDERGMVKFMAGYFKKIGLAPKVYCFSPRRDNLVVVLRGKKRGEPLLITPHIDTVPVGRGWKFTPLSGEISNGKIYGRGATDCKGNLAVAIEVVNSLKEDGVILENDLIFLATADEETGSSKGLIPFLKKNIVRPKTALILDSDEFNIITAQKGLIHFKVAVEGRKAHGAYPELGLNAIDMAIQLIRVLKEMKFVFKKHRLLKHPTVNIGTIRGGDKVNMVADWCEFESDLRFLPGMKAALILRQIRGKFSQTKIPYQLHINDLQEPYEIDEKHSLVTSLKKASKDLKVKAKVKGSEGATVITFFRKKNIPAIATGYGSSGCAHATDEFVRINDLHRGAQVLERFIKIFDGKTTKSDVRRPRSET